MSKQVCKFLAIVSVWFILVVINNISYEYAVSKSAAINFSSPEQVSVLGYDGDAMEPFITRDGKYLIFNNLNDPNVNTNLHYAERINDLVFSYKGELKGINTATLDAVASTDINNNIYFISPRNYGETFSTIYQAKFLDGQVSDVKLVKGVSRKQLGMVNFDAEISSDGKTLYFVDSQFVNNSPQTADIVIAQQKNKKFKRLVDSEQIMKNVNTNFLEYAPAISKDELTLFFTRLEMVFPVPKLSIYFATRKNKQSPFEKPQKVEAIDGFVEAPAFSPDEQSIYFHKKVENKFWIFRVKQR